MSDAVLVGDIGGTNVRLAQAHRQSCGCLDLDEVDVLQGDSFPNFEGALETYLGDHTNNGFDSALFAFAGPVRDNTIHMTNRDWVIKGDQLASDFGLKSVTLVNDYAAMARSIPELSADSFDTLHEGTPPSTSAPILVSGPGTGLGVATLIPHGDKSWSVITGQGGHAAYAPQTEREWELAGALRKRWGYVSKELVVSGIGLDAVHQALCDIHGIKWEKREPADLMAAADAAPGLERDICELRARATMGALGDAALINGAIGGVVITGGVALRLVKWLKQPESLSRFFDRGSQQEYMEAMPIRLLLSGQAALIGAAALHFDEERIS